MLSLLSALLAVSSLLSVNGAAISSSQCAAGPSYWCSNILAAKECFAMQYCLENNWATDKVETKDEQACSLCKKLITDTRDFVDANSTVEMVEQFLAQACQMFTDDFMVNECKTIEEHYLQQVLAMVKANLDPERVCTAAHICDKALVSPNDLLMQQLFKVVQQSVSTDYCSLCEETVGYMHTLAGQNGTKERVENLLMTQVCPGLKEKSLIKMCTETIQSSFPQLWAAVVAELANPTAMCTEFEYCSSQKLPSLVVKAVELQPAMTLQSAVNKGVGNASICDICKDAVALVERELDDAKAMVKPAVEQLCDQLGPLATQCEALADQALDALFQAADQLFNNESCSQWNLCAATGRYADKKGSNDANCDMCVKMVNNMYVLASKPGTESYVKNLVIKKGCESLKTESELLECKFAIDAGFSKIWSAILSGLQKPNAACAELGFCASAGLRNILTSKVQNIPWYRKY